jgi:hypothetical protein
MWRQRSGFCGTTLKLTVWIRTGSLLPDIRWVGSWLLKALHRIPASGVPAAANLGYLAEQMLSNPQLRSDFTEGTKALFMLNGFDGEASVAGMIENRSEYDTTTFGPALTGKSVLLISGTGDTVVPSAIQAMNVEAYGAVAGLSLSHHLISGEHSFSQSRIELQQLVVAWLMEECR